MDLLQEIRKEVSFKHTGIKQEPYSAPVHDTHVTQLQHDIAQFQTEMQTLKESMNTPRNQYASPMLPNIILFFTQGSKGKR